MKNRLKFLLPFFLLITASVAFLYYILVNTVFAEKILPEVSLGEKKIGFVSQDEFIQFVSSFTDNSIEVLQVNLDQIHYRVPIKDLNIKISKTEIENYGKGRDFIKVISEGLTLIGGKSIQLDISLNTTALVKYFPFNTGSDQDFAHFEGNTVKNCNKNIYRLNFNKDAFENLAKNAILTKSSIDASLKDVLLQPEQSDIISACFHYQEQLISLLTRLNDTKNIDLLDTILRFEKISNSYTFVVAEPEALTKYFQQIKVETLQLPSEGKYVQKGSLAYLYEPYKTGKILNIARTLEDFVLALSSPTQTILFFDETKPNILTQNLNIVDVTKLLGVGKTRIDIIRNGSYNFGMQNAENGLKAIDNFVIEPNTEFSFINASGSKLGKFQVGGGICNSTTTMFRLALESGFQITERHQHFHNIESYSWGYPENVVDAGYYTGESTNDLKFVNDLGYQVLLKLEITRDGNNFQYHTVRAYTSPEAPERKVEMYDFKRWDIQSDRVFSGSFSRKVFLNGAILREDTFSSRYY